MSAARRAVIAAARSLVDLGLTQNTSGNVSLRDGDGFLVTPTGMPAPLLRPADIVAMDFAGNSRGRRLPSSEWRFHRDIMAARPDVQAVVHAHAPYSTALSCLRRGIPAFHYMVAVAGGDSIRCGRYATFGTQALSRAAIAALRGRRACLLANHGLIATGATLDKALALAVEVEALARQYQIALQVGKPVLLGKAEMKRVIAKFATYGQPLKAQGRA